MGTLERTPELSCERSSWSQARAWSTSRLRRNAALELRWSARRNVTRNPDEAHLMSPTQQRLFSQANSLCGFHVLLAVVAMFALGCSSTTESVDAPKQDEAMRRADKEDFGVEQAAETYFTYRGEAPDFFRGMDSISHRVGGVPDQLLSTAQDAAETRVVAPNLQNEGFSCPNSEVVGRNTWMIWCGGNEGFWDYLATDSLGFIDFVKLVDSRKRNERFRDAGLINEPGMSQVTHASNHEFDLWLDQPEEQWRREWRKLYLEQTFQQIRDGKHKSQVGLNKRDRYGEELKDSPLYVLPINDGETPSYQRGYLYPSQYLPEEARAKVYQTAMKKYDETYGAEAKKDSGEPVSSDDTSKSYREDARESPSDDDDQKEEVDAAYKQYQNKYDQEIPPPDLYGISSGVIGLRLFPNPYFDKEAQDKWDAVRFYDQGDPYSTDPTLVRPFRVGMSCAFCHASFHPLRPPHDENNPEWTNISGSIGAQYLSMRATVGNLLTPDNFVYHLLESQPRGTIDTSLVASDNINNPNTMNAVFGLPQRAIVSLHNPQEKLSKASAELPSLWKDVNSIPEHWKGVAKQFGVTDRIGNSNVNPRYVPRILLDGADSIGTWGALARVYLNIGTYWEQWNELHQVVVGFDPQKPFTIADCETNSVYWNATERRVGGLRDYFLKVTDPMPLLSTEGGKDRLKPINFDELYEQAKRQNANYEELRAKEVAQHVDVKQLAQGRKVFAKNCIVCHSSIQPESSSPILWDSDAKYDSLVKARKEYRDNDAATGEFWEHDPARWLNDKDYMAWAMEAVEQSGFWQHNYLSTDYRIPVNVVETNSARAMATNGMTGHMWEDFASESYRNLPSPGEISYFNPYKGESGEWDSYSPRHATPEGAPDRGGGPGYYRVPTLISIWATAPFLHNNSLGLYNNDPSVEGRLEAFDDAIRKLLWPEKRLEHTSYNEATPERLKRDHGLIWRTTEETYLTIDSKRVPRVAQMIPYVGELKKSKTFRWLGNIYPLGLPSILLLLGAMFMLMVSHRATRQTVGYVVLFLVVLLALLTWIAYRFPDFSVLGLIRSIDAWLLILVLGIVGVALWIPRGSKSLKLASVVTLGSAILVGVLFLIAKSNPEFTFGGWLREVRPWQLPLSVLTFVGVTLVIPFSRRWTRFLSYGLIVASLLVGAIVHFYAGNLGDVRIGPIPAGTPVNLLANFNSEAARKTQVRSVKRVLSGLAEIKSRSLDEENAQRVMREKIAPALMEVNKCPDFVMDRGHYFPWFDEMTDEDKNALIELLKTF